MRRRAFHPLVAVLSALLLASTPVHAGTVGIGEVLQIIGGYQNPHELRLRSLSQIGSTSQTGINGSTRTVSGETQSRGSSDGVNSAASAPPDSLLSGVAVSSFDPQKGVEVISQGDIEGTVCDCGEITVPGGEFPKWPLFFLAGIPFLFIGGGDELDFPSSTPTPTPPTPTPTPEIPEPASLLLFGTGLAAFGAGLRRRYSKAKLAAQVQNTEEG